METLIREHLDRIDHAVWLTLLPLAGALVIYGIIMRRRALAKFANVSLLGFLAPQSSAGRRIIKAVLLLAGLTCVAVALLGPRWGLQIVPVQKRQLDVIVCLDVSRSMLANDAGMSRLDRAKDDIKRLLDNVAGGNIGLVTFAGAAELACPLTDDLEYFRLILDEVGLQSAPVGGTDLGKAILAARQAFGPPLPRTRAIILMTDGEDHGSTAIDEGKLARDNDISVYCIGIGDDKRGGLVPTSDRADHDFVMYNRQQVWSKLDPQRLGAIARAGGGEYHISGQVTNRLRTLEWIYDKKLLPKMERREDDRTQTRKVRFHWFAAAGLALLMLETLVREARNVNPLPMTNEQLLEERI
ncbi:MAG: VWA domain-containing protein [Phycisphaerales bacterium]|nr:VWA domain-containing protein [Phycisphaerales bacterium]MCB9862355.1 VWA domain-containing protein [Phycisphaerales bacterium]